MVTDIKCEFFSLELSSYTVLLKIILNGLIFYSLFKKKISGLPVPKALDSGGMVENDALEDLVKPKPSQVADIEKPAPKKLRQPVKITIPALPVCDVIVILLQLKCTNYKK